MVLKEIVKKDPQLSNQTDIDNLIQTFLTKGLLNTLVREAKENDCMLKDLREYGFKLSGSRHPSNNTNIFFEEYKRRDSRNIVSFDEINNIISDKKLHREIPENTPSLIQMKNQNYYAKIEVSSNIFKIRENFLHQNDLSNIKLKSI